MPEKNPPSKPLKSVETLTHEEASRINIPTAEYQSLIQKEYQAPLRVAYERRNRDLDPQLVGRGKDQQDWSDLVVNAPPPIYIQEKVHRKVLIDDLVRRTAAKRPVEEEAQIVFSNSLNEATRGDPRIASGELRIYSLDNLTSQSAGRDKGEGAASWFGVELDGRIHKPSLSVRWKTNEKGVTRLKAAGRLEATESRLGYVRYLEDFPAIYADDSSFTYRVCLLCFCSERSR